jgi:acetate kinase
VPDSATTPALLTINAGSSSLKVTIYTHDERLTPEVAFEVSRVGLSDSRLHISEPGQPASDEPLDVPNHGVALESCLDHLERSQRYRLAAVGHRVVHGGPHHHRPERITPALLRDLQQLQDIDPTHMPQGLTAIAAVAQRYPAVPQFACFDTAFHHSMPRVAQLYALPRALFDEGIRRYGFHGLSCEYILTTLGGIDRAVARGRLIVAHLGNGASLTAIHEGVSVDTTMGFSPTGGLMMGTRSGDLDPTVMMYLARRNGVTHEALERLVSQESGLLGVSGISHDMRDLLKRRTSSDAAEAVELFCYTARKWIGGLVAVLGGLDTIVFTGGIGEHAAPVRDRICGALLHLGVELDASRNAANASVVSADASRVMVRVMKTEEDLMIARHVRRLLASKETAHD